MEHAGVLIVSDEAEFSRAIAARWSSERLVPDMTLASSDVWATAIGERHDVVIIGRVEQFLAEVILEALAEQCSSTVIYAGKNTSEAEHVANLHPHVVTLSTADGNWLDALIAGATDAFDRTEATQAPAESKGESLEKERFAALGRYMTEIRPVWNNALTSVLGNADLMLLQPAELSVATRDQIETIQAMALRLHDMMQRFSSIDAAMRSNETASQAETESTAAAFAVLH